MPPAPVDHGVTCLIEQEAAILAIAPDLHNYVSGDGGLTWSEVPKSNLPHGAYCPVREDAWELFASADGQMQYHMMPRLAIERSMDAGKSWSREVDLTGESWQAKPQSGTPVKVEEKAGPFDAMVHRPTGNIVAAMGHLGVLVKSGKGAWDWVRVGNYYRGDVTAPRTPVPPGAASAGLLPALVVPQKMLIAHPQNTTNNSYGLAFSADSQTMAMVGFDAVHLWRTKDWSEIRTVGQQANRGALQILALSPDGENVAFTGGSSDKAVQMWNAMSGEQSRKLQGHTSWILSVAFSPDGQMLASGASHQDPTVRLWRVSDGTQLRTLVGHTSGVTSIAFSRDGLLLAAGAANHVVRVWRVADGTPLFSFQGGQQLPTLEHGSLATRSVTFSSDGQSLFVVDGDASLRVWSTSDGSLQRRAEMPVPHGFDVKSAAFSSDGKWLATGLGNGTIWLWRVTEMELVGRFTFNESWATVAEIAFSPDGCLLVAAGESGNVVRVWELAPAGVGQVGEKD